MKWTGAAWTALIGMAALALSHQTASADTVTLICNLKQPGVVVEDQPTVIDLDEAHGSVTVHYGPIHTDAGGPHALSARTFGPMPAKFDTNAITFSDSLGSYSINRLTGGFAGMQNWQWTCEPGKAKF